MAIIASYNLVEQHFPPTYYRKFNPIAAIAPATAHPTSALFAAAAPVNTVGPPVDVFVAPAATVIVIVVIPLWRSMVSV